MEHYKTTNFDIYYKKYEYDINTTLEVELIRRDLYLVLLSHFISYCDKLEIKEKKAKEIFFYFIIQSSYTNKIDPIFTNKPRYDIKYIENILKNSYSYTDYFHKVFIEILHNMELDMKKIYKVFIRKVKQLDNKKYYIVDKSYQNNLIVLSLIKVKNGLDNYILSFSIHISLYKHLIKLYALRNYNIYDTIDESTVPWFDEFNERLFILYTRYQYLSSGSTQASILPKFKKHLLETFGIKIELFASAINSSYTNYCSLFYDIEKYFGSLGSFFNTRINAGYYEINPPFEKTLIHQIFAKIYRELLDAEKNKRGLLFYIVISKINLTEIKDFDKMIYFLKYKKLCNKSEIPYLYYDKSFSYAITRDIIDTYILLFHTSFIKSAIKYNVSKYKIPHLK